MHEGVKGVPQDTEETAWLYRLAIQDGHPDAIIILTLTVEDDVGGVPQDTVDAARLYRLLTSVGDVAVALGGAV